MKDMLQFFLLLLLIPSFAFAQGIIINEIAWMGTPVQGVQEAQWWRYEWVELYNPSDSVGMLDGWVLELHRDTLDFRIPLYGSVAPEGYFLIVSSGKIQNADMNYANLGGKFMNSGQKVVLKNSKGEVVDEVDARKGWPAGENEGKYTMEKTFQGWQTSFAKGGTPRTHNSAAPALSILSQNEKDLLGSSPKDYSSLAIASVLASLSAALAVAARRRLRAPSEDSFDALED